MEKSARRENDTRCASFSLGRDCKIYLPLDLARRYDIDTGGKCPRPRPGNSWATSYGSRPLGLILLTPSNHLAPWRTFRPASAAACLALRARQAFSRPASSSQRKKQVHNITTRAGEQPDTNCRYLLLVHAMETTPRSSNSSSRRRVSFETDIDAATTHLLSLIHI